MVGVWWDGIVLLHEGDVIYIRPAGDGHDYALFVKDGIAQVERWFSWVEKDIKESPDFYITKGNMPWGQIPKSWMGCSVVATVPGRRRMSGGFMIDCYEEKTGTIISFEPFTLSIKGNDGESTKKVLYGSLWVSEEKK